jgi:hypothetical protein
VALLLNLGAGLAAAGAQPAGDLAKNLAIGD